MFDEVFIDVSCADAEGWNDATKAFAARLHHGYFRGFPATTEELFEGVRGAITTSWVQKYELDYLADTRVQYTDDALQYLYSGEPVIPVQRINNRVEYNPNASIDRRLLDNTKVFGNGPNSMDGMDRWIYQIRRNIYLR